MEMTRKSYFDVKKNNNQQKKETTVFELTLKFHNLSRHGEDFTMSPKLLFAGSNFEQVSISL
jgi:hypothetical protein